MTWRQWQAFLRLFLVSLGTELARRGVVSAREYDYLEPYLEAFIGSAVSLGAVAWSWWAHLPTTIVRAAASIAPRTPSGGA